MKRADLYKLVWEKPVTHVAKEYGISDVAVRKICVKHGIPTPPLGYWAKLQHGKRVVQTPLPPLNEGQSDYVNLKEHSENKLPPAAIEAQRIAVLEEASPESRIVVPTERPAKLHPIAAATEKALRQAKMDKEGFVTSQGSGVLTVTIGKSSTDRVALLIHSFLHAVIDRRHQLSVDVELRVMVDEQPLAIRIYETKDKIEHVPTAAELKRQAEEESWRARFPPAFPSKHKVYRSWDYFPSGRLMLEISDPKQVRWRPNSIIGRWGDRKSTRIEAYLAEMMVALKTGAAIARLERAKEAEEARIAKEAADRRRDQEIQRRLLEKVTKFLMEKADKYAQLTKLENLAAHLGADSDQFKNGQHSELRSALEFALINMRLQLSADSVNQEIVSRKLLDPESWY